jgi:cobalt-zinc-cadmium efflux system membrane fusion protein
MSNENALLQMEIFEKDLSYISIGQRVHAEDLSGSNKIMELTVNMISPNVDASGKVKVYCNLPNRAAIPGSIWNIQIAVPTANTLALPNSAIVSDHYIFLDKGNNTFEMKEVQLGTRNQTYSEILNATELMNENIVLTGAYTIYMQLKNSSEE